MWNTDFLAFSEGENERSNFASSKNYGKKEALVFEIIW